MNKEVFEELKKDEVFIEKVVNRIYTESDDFEDSMPESEWICEMTDIAYKYTQRFKLANKVSQQPILNDNQQVLLKWLKKKCDDCAFIPFSPFPAIRSLYYLSLDLDEIEVRNIIDELNRKQQAQVLRVFSDWVLEQEAE